ncbi:MAG: zinc-binding alcohol dehydrogenase family protein [Verrucomicrobiales bacterium]|nr:zinc-binding alcohol dehydrogenase family protein [Verrucomicrobiales bacterium]
MAEYQSQIVLSEPECFVESQGLLPVAEQGQALIRVRSIGVCGTDIHAYYGRQPFFEYPRILGHELGGEVVDTGGCDALKVGDRCCVEPYMNRPSSQASRRGKSNCCEDLQCLGVHRDGGMRSLIQVPVNKIHVSANLQMDQLALVEMLCIGAHAVDRGRVERGEYVLVIGAGPIGLSVVQFLQAQGAEVVVMDVDARRLAFCEEVLGVKKVVLAKAGQDEASLIRDGGGGDLPTVIFDATGNAASMMSNFERIAHGGRIVLVGLCLGNLSFDDPNFHRREISLLSSRNATAADFERVISMIGSGLIDTDPWITHRMRLSEVPQKFRSVIEDASLRKAMIEVDG